jgi:hypothetical protein
MGCSTDAPENYRLHPGCCAHATAAEICRAMWWIWSRLWEEEGGFSVLRVPCQLDSVGYCTVASRFDSGRLSLDLSEKGIYSCIRSRVVPRSARTHIAAVIGHWRDYKRRKRQEVT